MSGEYWQHFSTVMSGNWRLWVRLGKISDICAFGYQCSYSTTTKT
ncbi:unnamed protein product [Oppiella nova]|uniref:Uncharacterized protein n=1 Tax=Oppiella nova TaxID=334625 RepID=A0A7R9QQB4_9ACAR|nr:unnamed protein product [Oppiella nova]CAG2171136.1 unnamed protein product [Oppiella nova]